MQSASIPITNRTVHASAGSGKTYLLVSRIIQLLLNGAEPGTILAITFTRKAAAEMQERLLQRLFELASLDATKLAEALKQLDAPANDETCQRACQLYEQILNTEHPVTTTTFHAFCQDLLRRFPLEADVPAGFELIEQPGHLQDEAWEALMAEAAASPEGELASALDVLFRELSLFNTRQALNVFVQQRSDWWAFTRKQSDPMGFAVQRLTEQLKLKPDEDPLQGFFDDQQAIQSIKDYLDYLNRRELKTNQKLAAQIDKGLDERVGLLHRYHSIRQTFLTQKGEVRSVRASAALDKAYGKEGAEAFVALHGHCAEIILTTDERLAAVHTFNITSNWYRAGEALLRHYQRIKNEQRLLDFTDLEWKSFQLLNESENASWVQYKLDNRICHLLVDEFQDTNPTQWQLLLPLLQEFASQGEKNNSVFLVGDAKQSIYRFRRAEPRLFGTASDWLQEHMQSDRHPLNKSWRSSKAIIEFVNRLFGQGPLYDQLTEFEAHETVHESLWGKVTLLPLIRADKEQDDDAPAGMRNPLLSPRVLPDTQALNEGKQVADAIHQLIKDAIPVGDEGNARPIRYSDIMILLRSRTHVGEFEHALRQQRIPYLGAERGTLLEALEILDMVKLLQWLVSPYDNHALASILRSPLFNVDDQDLLMLAGSGKGNWFERLPQMPASSPLHHACDRLTNWLELAGYLPVHDLLDRIYRDANVLNKYSSAFPDNLKSRVRSNLIRFLELALESDSGRYPSLSRFIQYLNVLRQPSSDAPDEPPMEGQADRVRLLTIHEAKGLEASVVFLVDTARPLQRKTAYSALVDWSESEGQPETFLLTGRKDQLDAYSQLKIQQQLALEDREETNLLYVAVTRARQQLFISGTEALRGGNQSWYKAICQQYDIDPAELDSSSCLQETGTPANITQSVKQVVADEIDIEPGLAQQIINKPLSKEIAPSRMVAHDSVYSESLDEDARQRGIIIHKMLEVLSVDPQLSEDQLAGKLNLVIDGNFKEYLAEVNKLMASPDLKMLFDPAQYQSARNEVPVYYERGEQTVYGIIDRLVFMESEIRIIDYKTHRTDQGQLDTLAQVYQAQMRLYAEGIKKMWPDVNVTAHLLFTHPATLVPVKLEDA
ncbi:MAG: UvrD-helicase domain-containing protein [Gammaproteobacteria bacterium]|nr:UvrD-helicase domain-containing protein [Gammaproteobacteria bacterium]